MTARQTHLRRVAYAICGDWHRADDLLQTAFVKLYVAWPRLRDTGRGRGLRPPDPGARQRRRVAATLATREHQASTGTTGRPSAGPSYEERSALVDALQQLPLMQRKVVVLRHMLDLSVAQTADELGIGEGTVKSHTSRGLAALEQAMLLADG